MNSSEIQRKVRQFRKDFHVKTCTAKVLENIFKSQGFTVIKFNPVLNDEDVATVIRAFGLEEMVARSNGFLFMDKNHRLLFINEGLNDAEAFLVLAHEEGHYYLGHTNAPVYYSPEGRETAPPAASLKRSYLRGSPVIGRNVIEEFEANEFAHFLVQGSLAARLKTYVASHRAAAIAGAAALLLGGGIKMASDGYEKYQERLIYEGEFYVTTHGKKYHLETCVTIQGHEMRRLTKEDMEAGTYEPCSVCLPDKKK